MVDDLIVMELLIHFLKFGELYSNELITDKKTQELYLDFFNDIVTELKNLNPPKN
jgi:hypothetical protein